MSCLRLRQLIAPARLAILGASLFAAASTNTTRSIAGPPPPVRLHEAGEWSVYCKDKSKRAAEDCSVAQAMSDKGRPGLWLKLAFTLKDRPSKGMSLLFSAAKDQLRQEEGFIRDPVNISIDGRSIGSVHFEQCDLKACSGRTELSPEQVLRLIEGHAATFSLRTTDKVGVAFPTNLDDWNAAVSAMSRILANKAPSGTNEWLSGWNPGKSEPLVVRLVSPDNDSPLAISSKRTKGACAGEPRMVYIGYDLRLSKEDATRLDALADGAKLCSGSFLLVYGADDHVVPDERNLGKFSVGLTSPKYF